MKQKTVCQNNSVNNLFLNIQGVPESFLVSIMTLRHTQYICFTLWNSALKVIFYLDMNQNSKHLNYSIYYYYCYCYGKTDLVVWPWNNTVQKMQTFEQLTNHTSRQSVFQSNCNILITQSHLTGFVAQFFRTHPVYSQYKMCIFSKEKTRLFIYSCFLTTHTYTAKN